MIGQKVNRTKSGGLGVRAFVAQLLARNEAAVVAKDWAAVLNDDEIYRAIMRGFPDRWESQILRDVTRIRSRYNRGDRELEPPTVVSYRYARFESELWRISPRGRRLAKLGTCK